MGNFTQILDSLAQEIRRKYPTVDIVQEHQCLQQNEDDVYQFINIVHVPESIISDVEDYAYGLLRTISPTESLPIGFFLFTPDETVKKFPKYVRQETAEFTAQIAYRLFKEEMKPSEWQAASIVMLSNVDDRNSPVAYHHFNMEKTKAMEGQLRPRRTNDTGILAANQEMALAA